MMEQLPSKSHIHPWQGGGALPTALGFPGGHGLNLGSDFLGHSSGWSGWWASFVWAVAFSSCMFRECLPAPPGLAQLCDCAQTTGQCWPGSGGPSAKTVLALKNWQWRGEEGGGSKCCRSCRQWPEWGRDPNTTVTWSLSLSIQQGIKTKAWWGQQEGGMVGWLVVGFFWPEIHIHQEP